MVSILAELAAALHEGAMVTDPDIIESYRRDRAGDPAAGRPLAVVRAESTAEVQALIRWAGANKVPVVPRGAGSGLSGGATAVDGGVVLSLERMRGLVVDPAARVAVAGAGVINAEVKKAASEYGLWYPPDPSSFEISSIGGNVATNAGGLCCVKYGVTGDYVLGLEVVLADGNAVRLGGPRLKDVAGFSLAKLFVGSEGALGVITEATLRLISAPPPASTVVAIFASMQDAAKAVIAITARLRPSMLELMDNASVNVVESFQPMGLDRAAGALLLARCDSPGRASADEADLLAELCRAHGAQTFTTDDAQEGEAFAAARRAVLPAMERLGDLLLEDVGVPVPQLPALVEGIREIGTEYGVVCAVVAHAGDGNAHPVIVHDAADPDSAAGAAKAFGAIMDLAISLGGTITGEHGVGRLKQPWLAAYLGPQTLALTRRIKHALDPDGLLNPGAVI